MKDFDKEIFMELILIDPNKLKVILSEEDMENYKIDPADMDYSDHLTQSIIKDILDGAKSMTGFDADGQKLFIQMFTSIHGGCEMFITKAQGVTELGYGDIPEISRKPFPSIYSFESFYNLVLACRRLSELDEKVQGIAYSDMSGRYFLKLLFSGLSAYTRLDKFTFMLEYSKQIPHKCFDTYINEHGSWVCKNAVKILGGL